MVKLICSKQTGGNFKMDDLVIGTRIFIRDRDITIPYFNMIRNGTDEYCVQ